METRPVSNSTNLAQPFGEVISSSVVKIVSEARKEAGSKSSQDVAIPGFGSFIKTESSDHATNIVAVVYDVVTGPQDASHKPGALGLTRQQLRQEQPHIFALLKTEIHAVPVGYFENGRYFGHLAPHPAQVHDFVYELTASEIERATQDSDYLRLVANVSTVPADELIAACVRQACTARNNDYQYLITAGQALSHLFRDDYDRLLSLLKKIRPD